MPGKKAAATVVARNFLPHARVLARSLAAHHDDVRHTVVVVDGPVDGEEDFDVLEPSEVGIDARELHRRALLYDGMGLTSSLRPLLLRRLLDDGADAVVLVDADMLALAPLDDLWELASRHDVLLSPHLLEPLGGRPGAWREEEILRAGTFNGGLLGVGPGARPFLDWMDERGRRDCVLDRARGLSYCQTWLDLVPTLFDHAILRDPDVNVMVHRLGDRDLDDSARLFHFTGFDAARPDRLCRYYEDERSSLIGRPKLAALCAAYAADLRAAGWPAGGEYAWSRLPGGTPVDEVIRHAYRDALLAAESGEAEEPPDPFDEAVPEAFLSWLAEPAHEGVSRYLLALHAARPDLRDAFPRVPGPDAADLVRWAAGKVADGSPDVPAALAPSPDHVW